MSDPTSLDNYLREVRQRLEAEGFACRDDVAFDGRRFRWVAHRCRFELTKFGYSETFFVFADFASLDWPALQSFAADGFRYALQNRSVPLPRGFFESVWCYPVALVAYAPADVVEAVQTQTPPKHWASAEIPVIYEAGAGELHYFKKTPFWGAAYYRGFRQTIERLLGP